jgi:hypothetical protein
MKLYASIAAVALAASAVAQSPLAANAFAATNASGAGAVIFQNMTVLVPDITINRIDINTNAALGTQGRLRIWQTVPGTTTFFGNDRDFTQWQVLAEGSVTSAGLNQVSPCCFATPFTLTSAMGPRGYAFEHIGVQAAFTTGSATFANAELSLTTGVAASNGSFADQTILGGNVSIPFAVAPYNAGTAYKWNGNIHYAVGTSSPICSFSDKVGLSCGGGFGSWFNIDATPAQAAAKLQGKTLMMTPNANGAYDVTTMPALPLVPFAGHTALSGWASTIAGAVATDDGEITTPCTPFLTPIGGVVNSLTIHTNGMVSSGSNLAALDVLTGGGDDWAVTTTAMFTATGPLPNPTWLFWHDNDITTTGAIRFADLGAQVVVTYDAVPSFGPTGLGSTIQIVFDTVSNIVTVTFDIIDPSAAGGSNAYSGNPYLVGYTPGGVQTRPQYQIDTTPFATQYGHAGNLAHVALTSTPRPVMGSVIDYSVANMNALVPVGFLYFSVTNPFAPGLPLSAIGVGMPGCMLNFDLANSIGPFSFLAPGIVLSINTATVTPSMLGLDFWGQAIVFDFAAPDLFASLVSSNALHQRVEAN